MKIQYASDLHLELPLNRDFIMSGGMAVTGDVLVLAGDIGLLKDTDAFFDFWDWCSQNYRQTIIVPGNHDYYAGSDLNALRSFEVKLRDNVAYYHNRIVSIDNVDFICSTLWSPIKPVIRGAVMDMMPDYREIYWGDREVKPSDMDGLHAECADFIFDSIKTSKANVTIVVTHHLPSYDVVAPCYRTSPLTCAFAAELKDRIESCGPTYWIYGHSHANIEGRIGETRLVSNQLGYLELGEHNEFDDTKTIEIC